MKLDADLLAALTTAATDGNHLVLAGPRMDPKLYQRVNEVLEACGGRWVSLAGAHLFPIDAAAAIAPAIAAGEVVTLREKRNDAQYFPTPAPVVQRLLALADLQSGMEVLEPSAGSGAIVAAAAAHGAIVDCIERDPGYANLLADTGAARRIDVSDFLDTQPEPRYDRVLMNPPFTRGADIAHVQHALGYLKADGLLVSVMSHSVAWQPSAAAFRALVEERGGYVEALPDGAFAASGTGVRTVIVAIPAVCPASAAPIIWPVDTTPPAADVADLGDPAEIAAEIVAHLREATAQFEAVAEALAPRRAALITTLPLSAAITNQLTFDSLEEAS